MAELYYPVYHWMAKELRISSNELHVYAIINSFTEHHGQFNGSLQYIAECMGTDRGTVFRTLKRLTDKGLVGKKERFEGGVKYCDYVALRRHEPSAKRPRPVGETTTPLSAERPRPVGETTTPLSAERPHPVGETTTPLSAERPRPVGETTTHIKTDNNTDNNIKSEKGTASKKTCGTYRNVLLTDGELEKLRREFPDWRERVERLSVYMASTGKRYSDHLATIRSWALREERDGKTGAAQPTFASIPGGIVI